MSFTFFVFLQVFKSTDPIALRVLVGGLTGLIIGIVVHFAREKEKKQSREEQFLQQEQDLASNSPENWITGNDYALLYEELKDKCNPAKYLNPYNPERLSRANQIFSKLESSVGDIPQLIQLRNCAIQDLGVSFSTSTIFSKLERIYNPANFIGDNYNPEKLDTANRVFPQINNHKDDIIALEKIAMSVGIYHVPPSYPKRSDEKKWIGGFIYAIFMLVLILLMVIADAKRGTVSESSGITPKESAIERETVIQVRAPGVVALDEQFNVTFIIDDEKSPQDFSWSVGDDFQLVWGPQKGSSTSVSIMNGKKSLSHQTTYACILIPKMKGNFSLGAAHATLDGAEIASAPFSIKVVTDGASSSALSDE